MGTFPYPYMNGPLHLGHLFTASKVEFTARYKQSQGYDVLFPFGFHCTGMPIYAMSQRIAHKDPKAYDIVKACGIEHGMIKHFADPIKWLDYFPQNGQRDMMQYAPMVDWSRSFITTSYNPYYDSFVRWQFNKLRKLGLIEFGERNSIYCIEDDQPCADHDRQIGEGVEPTSVFLHSVRINKRYHLAWIQTDEVPIHCDSLELDVRNEWMMVPIGPELYFMTKDVYLNYVQGETRSDVAATEIAH